MGGLFSDPGSGTRATVFVPRAAPRQEHTALRREIRLRKNCRASCAMAATQCGYRHHPKIVGPRALEWAQLAERRPSRDGRVAAVRWQSKFWVSCVANRPPGAAHAQTATLARRRRPPGQVATTERHAARVFAIPSSPRQWRTGRATPPKSGGPYPGMR